MRGFVARLRFIGVAALLVTGAWAAAAPCPSPTSEDQKGCCGKQALACCCCSDAAQDVHTAADLPRLPSLDLDSPALPSTEPALVPEPPAVASPTPIRPNSERGPPDARFLKPGPARAPPLSA
jgi:hypothetical protein